MAALGNKKLLVLDVNGLLVATYYKYDKKRPAKFPHAHLGNFVVYKRPACEEFLRFCFENFVVGIWSSARAHNVNNLVDFLFKDLKPALAFSWHQTHCTTTEVMHPDNEKKPIFLKELPKLWASLYPGKFGPSNSLLVDDSPYKALKNPPHTGIFPRPYTADEADDSFLTVLRAYLEGVRDTADVQKYVSMNPIGEPSITSSSPLWDYFSSIVAGDLLGLFPATESVQEITGSSLDSSQHNAEYSNQLKEEGSTELQDIVLVSANLNRVIKVQSSQGVPDLIQKHAVGTATRRRRDWRIGHLSKNWPHLFILRKWPLMNRRKKKMISSRRLRS